MRDGKWEEGGPRSTDRRAALDGCESSSAPKINVSHEGYIVQGGECGLEQEMQLFSDCWMKNDISSNMSRVKQKGGHWVAGTHCRGQRESGGGNHTT